MKKRNGSHRAEVSTAERAGFTLLELLMVVAILGMVLVAITQLLGAVLSGSGKSSAIQAVKENGQFALSIIEKTVKRAKDIPTCSGGTLAALVAETGGDVTYTFGWVGAPTYGLTRTITPPGTASNLVDSSVRVTSFSCVLTAATSTAPAVASVTMTIDKPSLAVDQSVGTQTFTVSMSLRAY